MTKNQVVELMKQSIEEVKKQTLEELADYQESIEVIGLAATVDMINEEIDANVSSVMEKEVESKLEQSNELANRNRRTRKSKYTSKTDNRESD